MSVLAASTNNSANSGCQSGTKYADIAIAKHTSVLDLAESEQYSVSVPTTIILNGTPNAAGEYFGDYKIGVTGNILQDRTVSITPENNSIELLQSGKESVTGVVSQTQCSFDADDFSSNKTTNGQVSAKGLTAGNWKGCLDFIISPVVQNVYYSSIELAAADANALTTKNADVRQTDLAHAVASLAIIDNKPTISLMQDESNAQSFSLNKDTTIDLGNHTLTFGAGNYVTFTKGLSLINGTMSGSDTQYLLFGVKSNTGSSFGMSNVSLNSTISSGIKYNSYLLDVSCNNTVIDGAQFSITGSGNRSYGVNCCITRGTSLTITNSNFNVQTTNTVQSRATQFANNVTVANCSATIDSGAGRGQAFRFTGNSAKSAVVSVTDIKATVSGNTADDNNLMYGLYAQNLSMLDITGANLQVDDRTHMYGAGITASNIGKLIKITSTEDHPVQCFGKQWGITASAPKIEINGGVYTATNHAGYLGGAIEVHDAQFYVDRVDQYDASSLDVESFGPMYLGNSDGWSNVAADFYGCTFGRPDKTTYNYNCAVISQANRGYVPPENINLHDCIVYQGANIFGFQGTADSINQSKINLYGSTKLYDINKSVISKESFAEKNTGWQTKPYSSVETNTLMIGNNFVYGWAKVNKGTIEAKYVADSTGVYDYRD